MYSVLDVNLYNEACATAKRIDLKVDRKAPKTIIRSLTEKLKRRCAAAAASQMVDYEAPKVSYVYRIAPEEEWEAARSKGGFYGGKADDVFIHLSSAQQVPITLKRFYRGRSDLLLLKVDVAKLGGVLRWEGADGACFPHFYGPSGSFAPLPLESITEWTKLELVGDQHSVPSSCV